MNQFLTEMSLSVGCIYQNVEDIALKGEPKKFKFAECIIFCDSVM